MKGNDKYAQSDNKDIVLGIGWCKKAFSRKKKCARKFGYAISQW